MTKDTHGQNGEGWIGFDLDGTLAKYDGWKGIDHIGEPVGPMVDLVKKLHAEGKKVKILTARVAPRPDEEGNLVEQSIMVDPGIQGPRRMFARDFIRNWCVDNLGFIPEITHEKDHLMLDLYDDRCHQVIPNTGATVEEVAESWKKQAYELLNTVKGMKDDVLSIHWAQRFMCACIGAAIVILLSAGYNAYLHYRSERRNPEVELRDALNRYLETKAHEPVTEAVGRLLP